MTKKDFELIAAALRATRIKVASAYSLPSTDEEKRRDAQRLAVCGAHAEIMAERLATTNPRFDRSRFLAACGVQS